MRSAMPRKALNHILHTPAEWPPSPDVGDAIADSRGVMISHSTTAPNTVTDIPHLPVLERSSYLNGLLDSIENGLRKGEPRLFARPMWPILHPTPPGRQFRPVSAQRRPLSPLESPTFRSVAVVSHAAPTEAALPHDNNTSWPRRRFFHRPRILARGRGDAVRRARQARAEAWRVKDLGAPSRSGVGVLSPAAVDARRPPCALRVVADKCFVVVGLWHVLFIRRRQG